MTPLLETRALTVTYGERRALRPTDLTVAAGESLAVVGHNGSGKSSLLLALAALGPAAGGEVILHAEACHHRRRPSKSPMSHSVHKPDGIGPSQSAMS